MTAPYYLLLLAIIFLFFMLRYTKPKTIKSNFAFSFFLSFVLFYLAIDTNVPQDKEVMVALVCVTALTIYNIYLILKKD